MVGYTVTESPWDDQARAEAEALWEAEHLICPMCGNLREECSDPDGVWYPQRHICYATKVRDLAERKWTAKHDKAPYHNGTERRWAKEFDPKAAPFHFRDGARLYVAPFDVNPDDQFL